MTVERVLMWSSAAGSMAKGVMFSVSALFFTRVAGLSAGTVGIGLTVAGIVGVATAFAAGHLSDRFGARRILLGATIVQGAALGAYCFAHHPAAFVLVACVAVSAQAAQRTAQVTLIAYAFAGADRSGARARLRVVTNVFVAVGSGASAGVLAMGTRTAYVSAMLAAAALVLWSAFPLRALPASAPRDSHRPFVRDVRYLAIAALNGVVTIQFGLLTVGMPLWVTGHTQARPAMVGLLLVLNTGLVAIYQVRVTRRVNGVPAAGRAVFQAGLLLALSCVLYASAARAGSVGATAVLVLAVVVHSFGEILSEAGGWELAFELADPRHAGAYQGVSQTGFALGTALAPAVVTSTAIGHGTPGWLLLAATFGAAGVGTVLMARLPVIVRPQSPQHRSRRNR